MKASVALLALYLALQSAYSGIAQQPAADQTPQGDEKPPKGKYNVWVFELIDNKWTKRANMTLSTDDEKYAIDYTRMYRTVPGFTATTNARAPKPETVKPFDLRNGNISMALAKIIMPGRWEYHVREDPLENKTNNIQRNVMWLRPDFTATVTWREGGPQASTFTCKWGFNNGLFGIFSPPEEPQFDGPLLITFRVSNNALMRFEEEWDKRDDPFHAQYVKTSDSYAGAPKK